MFLIVGLGNPGLEYELTRHNIGFIAADMLSDRYNFTWSNKSKFFADVAMGETEFGKIILCKPQTFMNLSGKSVQAICSFYKILPENVIVIHDDIDISINQIKHKIAGGHGGHNGLKSIDQHISPNYHRIRIGVGRPDNANHEVSNYVLGKFVKEELEVQEVKIKGFMQAIDLLLSKDIEKFKTSLGQVQRKG